MSLRRERSARVRWSVVLVLAGAAACARGDDEAPAVTAEQPEGREQMPVAAGEDVIRTAVFRPVGESEELMPSGTARIIPGDTDGRAFRIAIDLENVPAGEHAWEIRRGRCDTASGETVVPAADRSLRADERGAVRAIVDVPVDRLTLEQVNGEDFALVLHAYPSLVTGGESAPMACADLGR